MGLLGAIANPPKGEDKHVEKVFNWSEVYMLLVLYETCIRNYISILELAQITFKNTSMISSNLE